MIFLELFLTFFKIGIFTFGGGYAMIPLIQEEVVGRGWLPLEELVNFIAVSESTPGPFAINIATYVGSSQAGVLGAVCSTLGVVTPSFIVILVIALLYEKLNAQRIMSYPLTGLRPAVIGLIGAAALSIGYKVFFPDGFAFSSLIGISFIASVLIFAFALFALLKKKSPIAVIGVCAALGIAAGYIGELVA